MTAGPVKAVARAAMAPTTTAPAAAGAAAAGTEMLGITVKKHENFSEWYTQVITRSDMVEYYDISGCYILRPWSFFIWESIQEYMNRLIRKLGVQNAYFPMFVSRTRLEAEAAHVEGFSPEVAWVTKYGDSDLAEPIAIRPTSETIMYPAFSKWIRSHRDLPLKLNQWCQVVRWEFKQPTPFIRTREFLWQEGHTAHSTSDEATEMVMAALDIYYRIYQDLLAIPMIKGYKSENEKFAGGSMTTTVETMIPETGRSIQSATSHHLGSNFSKMFGIEFEDQEGKKQLVQQTSWGISTRSLGVAVMIHGDDKGMVMPPRVAPVQVVIIPIVYKDNPTEELLDRCKKIETELSDLDVRVKVDDRKYTPGWKYNDWEKKGVCLRLELGPRDLKQQTARLIRRDTGEKTDYPWEGISTVIVQLLDKIHESMFKKAKSALDDSIVQAMKWEDVIPAIRNRKIVLVPWCEDESSEEEIKKQSAALLSCSAEDTAVSMSGSIKSLCIPLEQPPMPEGTPCFFTGKPAKRWCYFGRSY